MNKRIYLAAALVAAMTAFTGCTSEEELAQVVQKTDTGIPFTINATTSDGATRATDATSLSTFQLYAYDETATPQWWISNVTFNKPGNTWEGTWTDGTPNWPTTAASDFYAVSNNVAASDNVTGDITTGSFNYTLPTAVASQEDLLVGYASGTSATSVNISLKHALAAVTSAKLRFNARLTGANDKQSTYVLIVKSITFHNFINKGTFTFAKDAAAPGAWNTASLTEAQWLDNTDKANITVNVNKTFNYTVPAAKTTATVNRSATDCITEWIINLTDYIYLLPQAGISAWDPGTQDATTKLFENNPENAYVSIKCVLYNYIEGDTNEDEEDPDYGKTNCQPLISDSDPAYVEDAADDAGGNLYIPFKPTSVAYGKGYALTLNVVETYTDAEGGIGQTFANAKFNN